MFACTVFFSGMLLALLGLGMIHPGILFVVSGGAAMWYAFFVMK